MVDLKLVAKIVAAIIFAQGGPGLADDDCPRTIGSDTPFREPWPNASTWFGTEVLAVILPKDGIWPTTKPGARISVKVFWYSTEFQATAEKGFDGGAHLGFKARIRRLDAGPNDAVISGPNWAGLEGLGENWTILTGIDFQSAGCWEIIGGYLDQSLTFIVQSIDHNKTSAHYKRNEAKAALMQIAVLQERLYLSTETYSNDMTQLDFATDPFVTDSGWYTIDMTVGNDTWHYSATATYNGTDAEVQECLWLRFDSLGNRTSGPNPDCWMR